MVTVFTNVHCSQSLQCTSCVPVGVKSLPIRGQNKAISDQIPQNLHFCNHSLFHSIRHNSAILKRKLPTGFCSSCPCSLLEVCTAVWTALKDGLFWREHLSLRSCTDTSHDCRIQKVSWCVGKHQFLLWFGAKWIKKTEPKIDHIVQTNYICSLKRSVDTQRIKPHIDFE